MKFDILLSISTNARAQSFMVIRVKSKYKKGWGTKEMNP